MLTHAEWLQAVFARQDAVKAAARDLTCPACGSHQLQIMNAEQQGVGFDWRCRMCKHRFTTC